MKLKGNAEARFREEQRQARQAADVFERICRDGDAERLYDAHLLLNESPLGAWRLAMAKVAKLQRVSADIQYAFVNIWVESKTLPARVGHRPIMAAALRVLMPGQHSGQPSTLYRGANTSERRLRIYRFSWTTDIATAREFAEPYSHPDLSQMDGAFQGVVLKTVAPPEAVLLIRQPEDYYDEGEVVVDPFRLGKVEVVERISVVESDDARSP